MTNYAKILVGALADFVISAGGIITGAMVQQGSVVLPTPAVLVMALVAGVVTAAVHVKAGYLEPPK